MPWERHFHTTLPHWFSTPSFFRWKMPLPVPRLVFLFCWDWFNWLLFCASNIAQKNKEENKVVLYWNKKQFQNGMNHPFFNLQLEKKKRWFTVESLYEVSQIQSGLLSMRQFCACHSGNVVSFYLKMVWWFYWFIPGDDFILLVHLKAIFALFNEECGSYLNFRVFWNI